MTSDEFKEVQEGVRNYVIKMCGYLSIDDQMDLEQDAMLQAVRYQHTYDPTKSSLKTWGRNIAFSVSWRQEQKRRSRNSKARMVPFDEAFNPTVYWGRIAAEVDAIDPNARDWKTEAGVCSDLAVAQHENSSIPLDFRHGLNKRINAPKKT